MKTIKPTERIQMQGSLDKVSIENNFLRLAGWASANNIGAIESLKISSGGKEFTEFEMALGIKSPDVKETYPKLEYAQNARFRVLIPLNKENIQQVKDSLITVTPIFQQGQGSTLLHILEPCLPVPGEDDGELLNWIGASSSFLPTALEFLGHFLQLAELKPTDNVLDIGCGMGRMAYGLGYYLAPTTKYEGFDIMEPLIEWANKKISARFPNFNFRRVDIYNQLYNPTGTLSASEFSFPYENNSFDFVFLGSVFTHIPANEVRHYLAEIYRVLKPGGRCLCTMFLYNEESAALIQSGKSSANLVYQIDDYFATSLDLPEQFTGFRENEVSDWICDRNLTWQAKHYGSWCGRSEFTSYQDILILKK